MITPTVAYTEIDPLRKSDRDKISLIKTGLPELSFPFGKRARRRLVLLAKHVLGKTAFIEVIKDGLPVLFAAVDIAFFSWVLLRFV
ncbi:MAG: hypothetical protein CSB48_09245 [Proteobacteria bacterium]|nr:MAG: hypothetical protein CSB48_09245 [Pseudomonadota bacterium]